MAKKVVSHIKSPSFQPLFNFQLRTKYIFLAIIGFIFYANSLSNNFALDDSMVIEKNAYVQMGFSGIPKILTHDSYSSFYTSRNSDPSGLLSEGRYRPLSQVIFAIEQQFLGNTILLLPIMHLVNVMMYILCILMIFIFLDKFLLKKIPCGGDIAFVASILFAIHPLHTEVVANIKSLDEILSLLFIMLTFIYSITYLQNKKIMNLAIAATSYLFALLSKEYAVVLLFFIPFLFFLLEGKKLTSVLLASMIYFGVFIFYLVLRYHAIGFHSSVIATNLKTNPYFFALHSQKIATEWFVLGKYLRILLLPFPLSCDYSYYQIKYHDFGDFTVLMSLLIYLSLFAWGIFLAFRKNILSFPVFFFLLTILMISNFIIDIGAVLGERLVFHASLGFVIVLAYFLVRTISAKEAGIKLSISSKRKVLISLLSIIGIVCFGETITRNAQWNNDFKLFIHDVNVVPFSFFANSNAGTAYLSLAEEKGTATNEGKALLDSAHKYLLRGLSYNPGYTDSYLNLGGVYLYQGVYDSTKYCLDMAYKLYPNLPELKANYYALSQHYFDQGFKLAKNDGKPREGIIYMKKALLIDSANSSIWFDIGIAYSQLHQLDSAKYAFIKTLQNHPDSSDGVNAQKCLNALIQIKSP